MSCFGGLLAGVVESAVGPMPVRAQDARQFAGLALGPIQIAGDKMPRVALQIDAIDGVGIAIDAAMNHGVGRRARRHRP